MSNQVTDAMYADQSDNELIQLYVKQKDEKAFETLVRRHYDTVRKRLLMHTKNTADADDLSQALWIKVLGYLPSYEDNNKFSHFINTVATNLLRDLWRKQGVRNENSLEKLEEEGQLDKQGNVNIIDSNPTQHEYAVKTELEHLTKTLIPQLPSQLRMVFLLKHESEYWDEKQPFHWQHLADLNNMDLDKVWTTFQSARDKLVISATNDAKAEVSVDELQIFLVWTQTQRVNKTSKFTEQYFADLLNIPVNTFKTHYRKAVQLLNEEMNSFSGTTEKAN